MIAQALEVYDTVAEIVGADAARRVLQALGGLSVPAWSQTQAALVCRDLAGRNGHEPSCGQLAARYAVSRSTAAHWRKLARTMRNVREKPGQMRRGPP